MKRQDFDILEDLVETLDQIGQRLGDRPKRGYPSSSQKLRQDVSDFAESCRRGELAGRARKRKSGELFRRICSTYPGVWSK
jgi:hypothetical protein